MIAFTCKLSEIGARAMEQPLYKIVSTKILLWCCHSCEPITLEAVGELLHPMVQQGGKMMIMNQLH